MEKERIARLCHELNKAYCESLGDTSQKHWEEAPEWQRQSAINGVEFHLSGSRKPSDSHVNWMKEKLEQGWKFGPVKDEAKKEHPCLVPYDDLPEEQKMKDKLFTTIVNAFKSDGRHV